MLPRVVLAAHGQKTYKQNILRMRCLFACFQVSPRRIRTLAIGSRKYLNQFFFEGVFGSTV